MIKYTISLVLAFCVYSHSYAQQLPLFTQSQDYIGIINPAAISNNFLLHDLPMSIGATYRRQWTGFENAPQTQTIRFDLINPNAGGKFKLLTGGHIMNDQTGPTGMTGVYGKIGAVLSEDPSSGGFSAALSAGVSQYRVDASKFRARDLNDVLTTGSQSKILPDVGLGLYYFKRLNGGFFDDDWVSGGVSVPQVFGLNLNYKTEKGEYNIQRIQHIYANASWIHFTDRDRETYLQPSVMFKYAPNAPLNADINLRYQFNPAFFLGLGSSTGGNFHAETGFNIGEDMGLAGMLRLGYSFDYAFSNFGPYAGSTHELNVVYAFGNNN